MKISHGGKTNISTLSPLLLLKLHILLTDCELFLVTALKLSGGKASVKRSDQGVKMNTNKL